jgi:hypothetical protein
MNDNMLRSPRVKAVTPSTIQLPQMNIPCIPLPEKMEIRVVEYTKGDKIVKVELQYRMWNFDEYGMIVDKTDWEPVERVKIDLDGDI